MSESAIKAVRGAIIDLIDDPARKGQDAVRYYADGLLIIEGGKVKALGPADTLLTQLPVATQVTHYDNHLIVPGFIDSHIHFPQTQMIASYGEQLLTWLQKYTFATEKQFADHDHAATMASFFLDELLRHGTTTAMVFATVHPESVDALFSEAQRRRLRIISGKVMMDSNCPEFLRDTPQQSYQQSRELIQKWHGVDRLSYAVTPRFAPTSSAEQLRLAGQLLLEFPDVYLQTHLAESQEECAWVQQLFPDAQDYLAVYQAAGLVGPRSVFAHAIHLSPREYQCLHNQQASIAHCPTSNLFMGSGLFNMQLAREQQIEMGLATDVGAGSSFSMLQTFNEAYKVQQLQGVSLSAFEGLYLCTLGGARVLNLENTIGNFNVGCEADFVVLDKSATPLLDLRIQHAEDVHDELFALMMLGDDRAIYHTYILGELVHCRDGND